MIRDHYLTMKQAAEARKVTRITIWRWIKAGKLPAEKVGREVLIRKQDLRRLTGHGSERDG